MNHKQKKREQRKKDKASWQAHREDKRIEAKAREIVARFPLEMVRENVVDRACAECQACCTAVAVHELDKSMYTRCQHQCDQGCSIYEQRPESCRTYYCLWQVGLLKGEENRPDKLGIIFDFRAKGSTDVISAWELWEGAADQPRVKDMLHEIGTRFVICVRRFNSSKRRLIGQARHFRNMTYTEHG